MSAPTVHEPAVHEQGTVAVGYDGSETAQLAVNWAAAYAADAGLSLRVVHAWVWPVFTKNLGPVKGVAGSGLRHSAETILAEGVELARSAAAAASGTESGRRRAVPPEYRPARQGRSRPRKTERRGFPGQAAAQAMSRHALPGPAPRADPPWRAS